MIILHHFEKLSWVRRHHTLVWKADFNVHTATSLPMKCTCGKSICRSTLDLVLKIFLSSDVLNASGRPRNDRGYA